MLNSLNSARLSVDVLGSDIDNLVLNVGPGMSVTGHIRIEGRASDKCGGLQRISISSNRHRAGASILAMIQGGDVRPAADGTFPFLASLPGTTSS